MSSLADRNNQLDTVPILNAMLDCGYRIQRLKTGKWRWIPEIVIVMLLYMSWECGGQHPSSPLTPPSDTTTNIARNIKDPNMRSSHSPWQGGHLDQFNTVQQHSSVRLNGLLKENMPQCTGQTVTGWLTLWAIFSAWNSFSSKMADTFPVSWPTNNRKGPRRIVVSVLIGTWPRNILPRRNKKMTNSMIKLKFLYPNPTSQNAPK